LCFFLRLRRARFYFLAPHKEDDALLSGSPLAAGRKLANSCFFVSQITKQKQYRKTIIHSSIRSIAPSSSYYRHHQHRPSRHSFILYEHLKYKQRTEIKAKGTTYKQAYKQANDTVVPTSTMFPHVKTKYPESYNRCPPHKQQEFVKQAEEVAWVGRQRNSNVERKTEELAQVWLYEQAVQPRTITINNNVGTGFIGNSSGTVRTFGNVSLFLIPFRPI